MRLSACEFDRLKDSIVRGNDARAEQRRDQRLPVSATVSIVPLAESDTVLRVRVIDLSPQGMCLVHRSSMSLGSEFFVRIPQEGDGRATFIRCVVRSCTAAGDGLFRIGGEFCELDVKGPCLLSLNARDFD